MSKTDITPQIQEILSDSPKGFDLFYAFIHGTKLPKHAFRWIEELYNARKKKRGIIIEAFRGSTKTTTLTTYLAYRIGLEPHKANLIIQVGDDIAKDNSSSVADIIENNNMWKVIFPHVAKDKDMGWSPAGFEVKRTDMPYEEWRRLCAKRKDPTFIGLGRTSRAIIGKHPDGMLIIDDIDDENTTASDRERLKTQKILTGTIFPTITPGKTWAVMIGTPWTTKDTIAYMKSTGQFEHCKTPVYDKDGEPVWPDVYGHKEIEHLKQLSGELEFARMFLLDLKATMGLTLKKEWLHEYPHEEINSSWEVVMGIDYASTEDKLKTKGRDYFCLAVGRLLPNGGCVLVDGIRKHVSQGEAVQYTQEWAAMYPTTTMIVVEREGSGGQFIEMLRYNTNLPIHTASTADRITPEVPTARNKGARFQGQMAPLFQFSRVKITDEIQEFMTHFRNEWLLWPRAEHDDTLDATYYMCYGAMLQGALARPALPKPRRNWYGIDPEPKPENPWNLGGGRAEI